MFSYFFNTSPQSALSSFHSVLANYTYKANRKLNIPMSRDYQQSGAVSKHCGGGTEVGQGRSLLSSSHGGTFPCSCFAVTRAAEEHSRIWSSVVCQDSILQGQTSLDGGTEVRKDCAPGQAPPSPQPRSVNHLSSLVGLKQSQPHVLMLSLLLMAVIFFFYLILKLLSGPFTCMSGDGTNNATALCYLSLLEWTHVSASFLNYSHFGCRAVHEHRCNTALRRSAEFTA